MSKLELNNEARNTFSSSSRSKLHIVSRRRCWSVSFGAPALFSSSRFFLAPRRPLASTFTRIDSSRPALSVGVRRFLLRRLRSTGFVYLCFLLRLLLITIQISRFAHILALAKCTLCLYLVGLLFSLLLLRLVCQLEKLCVS